MAKAGRRPVRNGAGGWEPGAAVFDYPPNCSLSGNTIFTDSELKVMGVQYTLPPNQAPYILS